MASTRALTATQVAAILGVTGGRVRQLLGSGELRGEKFAHVWAIRPEEIERYRRHQMTKDKP